jgi:hypothetical protein
LCCAARFGNEAFVTWYDKMVADLPYVMQRALLPLPETGADDGAKQRHALMIGTRTTIGSPSALS